MHYHHNIIDYNVSEFKLQDWEAVARFWPWVGGECGVLLEVLVLRGDSVRYKLGGSARLSDKHPAASESIPANN